ncbi:MAG: SH3 domain-containing protein [Verrucomicrobia bacterium]|nr:SH3 domain-containing protein [Verrucomicrobiota bacterium]
MTTRIALTAGILLIACQGAFSLVVRIDADTELYAAQVPVIGTVKLGEVVTVLEENGSWCRVRFRTPSGEFSEGQAEVDAFARKDDQIGRARRSTLVYALSRPVLATMSGGSKLDLIGLTSDGYRVRFMDPQGRQLTGIVRASAIPDSDDVKAWRQELAKPAEVKAQVESPVALRVGKGELRVRFQFLRLYIPVDIPRGNDALISYYRKTLCGYSGFLFVGYRESPQEPYKKPTEGFFRVNGRAEMLRCASSNGSVVHVLGLDDDDGVRVEALAPGRANLLLSLAGQTVMVPLEVVQIPIRTGDFMIGEQTGRAAHTKQDVIKILGLPDERQETLVQWPDSAFFVGQFFSPPAGATWRVQRWRYRRYPGAEIVFVGNSAAYYARSAQALDVADTP